MERPQPERPAVSIDAVEAGTRRLRETVAELVDGDLRQPCALPGWSRAHLVAHLALNALGITRVFDGLARGEVLPVYDSSDSRAADIESWSGIPGEELHGRFADALDGWARAARGVPDEAWQTPVPRTLGSPVAPAWKLIGARRREVEIHHCDLDTGYTREQWAPDFVVELLDAVVGDHAKGPAVRMEPDDLDGHWVIGTVELGQSADATPTVTGPAADLGWWLVGRGEPATLRCDLGALPTIGGWR